MPGERCAYVFKSGNVCGETPRHWVHDFNIVTHDGAPVVGIHQFTLVQQHEAPLRGKSEERFDV
jgi:hypothetical protein